MNVFGSKYNLESFGVEWKFWKILGVDMQFVDKLLGLICNFGKLWLAGIGLSKQRYHVGLKLIVRSNTRTTTCLHGK